MIRNASIADSSRLATIYNHYIEYTTVTFEEQPVSAGTMATRLRDGLDVGTWLVAEQEGTVAGYARSAPWGERAGYRTSVETSVYLDHLLVGAGIGTRLYSALIEQLRRRQVHSAIGVIGLPNDASVGLHEKLGFVKVGELEEIGTKFDRWVNVGYWQLLL